MWLFYLFFRTVANYLLWRFVRHRVNNLDSRFQEAKQRFYYVLFGREKSPPRWQVCVAQVNSNLGMAVGSLFVKKYFDETSKNDVCAPVSKYSLKLNIFFIQTLAMTKVLQQSFREILQKTNWLDLNTKQLARSKIDAMSLRIGYPDFILDPKRLIERYKDVSIHPDYYFENMLSILKVSKFWISPIKVKKNSMFQHLTKVEQSRLGTIVNKTLWNTAPAIVNAYYSRNKNQISKCMRCTILFYCLKLLQKSLNLNHSSKFSSVFLLKSFESLTVWQDQRVTLFWRKYDIMLIAAYWWKNIDFIIIWRTFYGPLQTFVATT